MTLHPRTVWVDNRPVTGPAPKAPVRQIVFHWPGTPDVPSGLHESCQAIRNMHRAYLDQRGYSLGYSWAITRDGHAIEIRGDEFNNAANAGKRVDGNANDWTRSLLLFVGTVTDTTVTPQQLTAVRQLLSVAGYGHLEQIVHGDIDYTSCAGPAITAAVRNREFYTPTEEAGTMFVGYVKHKDAPFVYKQYANGTKAWLRTPEVMAIDHAVTGQVFDNTAFMSKADNQWMEAAGFIVGPKPPGVNDYGVPN